MKIKRVVKNILDKNRHRIFIVIICCIVINSISEGVLMAESTFIKPLKIQIKQATGIPQSVRENIERFDNTLASLSEPDIDDETLTPEQHFKHIENRLKKKEDDLKSIEVYYGNLTNVVYQSVKKELPKYPIKLVEDNADVVITIGVQHAEYFKLTDETIIEEVTALGYCDSKEVLNIVFKQEKNNIDFRIWKITKTPEQIGVILAKKIVTEIKNLPRNK